MDDKSHAQDELIAPDTVVTSDELRLRIVSLDDAPFIFSATRQPGFNDGMLWDPPQHMDELIPPYHRAIKAWKEQRSFSFTVEQATNKIFYGRISIRKTETEDRWNIGFWTHPDYQGKGIMTEAVNLILSFGFNHLKALVIEACYATWNKASESVLTKNGFSFVDHLEQGFMKRDVWVPENVMAITKEDWSKKLDSLS